MYYSYSSIVDSISLFFHEEVVQKHPSHLLLVLSLPSIEHENMSLHHQDPKQPWLMYQNLTDMRT